MYCKKEIGTIESPDPRQEGGISHVICDSCAYIPEQEIAVARERLTREKEAREGHGSGGEKKG